MAEQPDLSGIPTLQSFFETPELYERYHIHLIGVRPKVEGGEGIKNAFCDVVDPYVKVNTFGKDTGSTDFFEIGSHTFPVLYDSRLPLWDTKCLLIAKKGTTEGIEFTMLDKNLTNSEELFRFRFLRSEMPQITPVTTGAWTEYTRSATSGRTANTELVFRVMVTDGADRIVSKVTMDNLYRNTESFTYTEEIISPENSADPGDNALLQCWRQHSTEKKKAVLWIVGRYVI